MGRVRLSVFSAYRCEILGGIPFPKEMLNFVNILPFWKYQIFTILVMPTVMTIIRYDEKSWAIMFLDLSYHLELSKPDFSRFSAGQ